MVWLPLRSDLRHRWRAWIGLALIVGFAAGSAMALAQAARRSEGAYRTFSDRKAAADLVMTGYSTFGLVGGVDLDAVARSGFVERSARAFVALPFSGKTDTGKVLDATTVFPVASHDDHLGSTVERWKMLAGRPARPTAIGEATASFLLAERLDLHVGSRLELRLYRASSFLQVALKLLAGMPRRVEQRRLDDKDPPDYADGPRVTFKIVGIEASPAEFPPLITELAPVLHLTPAFEHRYAREIVGSPIAYIKLRPDRSLKSFQLAVERMAAGRPVSFVSTRNNQAPKVQRSIHAEALALAVVAALVGLAGAVGVGQAMTRQTLAESEQLSALRSLGMQAGQIRAIVLARCITIGIVGSILAGVVTVFLSQYALLPLARKAELFPGAHVDVGVLVVGVVAVIGLSSVIGLWSAAIVLRTVRPSAARLAGAPPRARSKVVDFGTYGVFPLSATLGVRFALQRARRAVPAWATVLAVGLVIAVLAGALTFTTNLQRLLTEPGRYGWNWDVKIGAPGLPDFHSALEPSLAHDPSVAALSQGTVTQIDVGRARIDVLAIDRVKGDDLPTMLAGRAPRDPDEIALGGKSMRSLRTRIGGTVTARIGTRSRRLRVVGRSVLPEYGDAGQLGTGSLMTLQGLKQLLPDAPINSFLVRFTGVHNSRAEGELLGKVLEPVPARFQARPEDLVDLSRGGDLLVVLAVLLSILGFVLFAHALVTAVRARRREFAMLRSLGFVRRQVGVIVMWQVLTLVAGALVVGLLIGSIIGQLAWRVFARGLGVASDAVISPLALLAVTGGALIVALLSAIVPAWIAARSRPTGELHAE